MQAQSKHVRCVILIDVVPGFILGARKGLEKDIMSIAQLKGKMASPKISLHLVEFFQDQSCQFKLVRTL